MKGKKCINKTTLKETKNITYYKINTENKH